MNANIAANRNIIEMEYAVRGPIPQRAAELKKAGKKIIPCNIGNPQALGQQPVTYYRQVLGLLENSSQIARERELKAKLGDVGIATLPDAVLDTAERILKGMESGVGAYSDSNGPAFIREAVSAFIDRRDGGGADFVPSRPDYVFLSNGASEAVRYIIEVLTAAPTDGIMVPIPQYPLYSATITKCGGRLVEYHPDEEAGWTLSRAELERSYAEAQKAGTTVKGIVVINPGNPTGAILPEESVRDVLDFAAEHGLVVIADEVYQENVYGAEFVSFAKVLGSRDIPLFSLHSVSKGFYGECGHRGGYVEVRNPPHIEGTEVNFAEVLYKMASVSLCPNTIGQVLIYLMVSPPEAGTEPYELFAAERARILGDLETKATRIREAFGEMEGVECFGRIGAMYLFPRLGQLPAGTGDFEYCMALLEETGLCTVNGSGFGQAEGTNHLRIAFLPGTEQLEQVLPSWIAFHHRYVNGS